MTVSRNPSHHLPLCLTRWIIPPFSTEVKWRQLVKLFQHYFIPNLEYSRNFLRHLHTFTQLIRSTRRGISPLWDEKSNLRSKVSNFWPLSCYHHAKLFIFTRRKYPQLIDPSTSKFLEARETPSLFGYLKIIYKPRVIPIHFSQECFPKPQRSKRLLAITRHRSENSC